jgi:hypothetical protein
MKPLLTGLLILMILGGLVTSCSLDQVNPNAPTNEQVLSGPDGIKALAIGMQAEYSAAIWDVVAVSSFLSKEYATMPSSVAGLRELETGGGDVQPFNGTVNTLWSRHYRTIKSAEDLITNVPNVTLVPGTRSGILALARTLKAMSLGELIEAYQQVPVTVTTSMSPVFADRNTVLSTVISLLETARDEIATTPPSSDFNSTVLAIGFDLPNTINAMIARYALIAGDNVKALNAANAVNLARTSTLFYTSTTAQNPLYTNAILLAYYKPVRSFRSNAEVGDRRPAYWVTAGTLNSFLGTPVDEFAKYTANNSPYYVYLPGEIMLIKAEVYARQSDLPNALIEVNNVRTKTTDAAGIGAGLAAKTAVDLPTQQAMLDEIYNQRYYELFIGHLRLGDTRRFGKPGAETAPATRSRTRNWLPYPDTERLANPNTPADPAI